MLATRAVHEVRRRGALALRQRVAGPEAQRRAELIWQSVGPRWFTEQDPIWRVHADASMFAGGIRALLLQSLHPLALAGVEDHSEYRDDPWRRVQNTSEFLAATTFGTVDHAERMIRRVRAIHTSVQGELDGTAYAASDPHLLGWVHVAEVDSFLATYQAFGPEPLSQADADRYVAQSGEVAARLGVVDPPTTEAGLHALLEAYRPELRGSADVRKVTRFLLLNPPLPVPSRPGYGLIAAGAVATLPDWARRMLALPRLPPVDEPVGRLLGSTGTQVIRWLMSDPAVAR